MKRFFAPDPICCKRQCPNHDSLFCVLRVLRVLRDSDSFRDSDDKRIDLTEENIKQDVYDSQITDLFFSTSCNRTELQKADSKIETIRQFV